MSDESLRELERRLAVDRTTESITAYVNALTRLDPGHAVIYLFTKCLDLEPAQFELLKERACDESYRRMGIDPELMRQMKKINDDLRRAREAVEPEPTEDSPITFTDRSGV